MSVVTITDRTRVVWSGPYATFERDQLNKLSVSEFCLLWSGRPLIVSGMAGAVLCVSLRHPSPEGHRDIQ